MGRGRTLLLELTSDLIDEGLYISERGFCTLGMSSIVGDCQESAAWWW